jgi:hypothetical protein
VAILHISSFPATVLFGNATIGECGLVQYSKYFLPIAVPQAAVNSVHFTSAVQAVSIMITAHAQLVNN